MRAYQAVLPDLDALGTTLVAISPLLPDGSLAVAEKNELRFPVLSDLDNRTARRYGIVIELPEETVDVYTSIGRLLPAMHGSDSWELPVPGTFVVDRAQVVRWTHVDVDHLQRPDPLDVLAAVRDAAG